MKRDKKPGEGWGVSTVPHTQARANLEPLYFAEAREPPPPLPPGADPPAPPAAAPRPPSAASAGQPIPYAGR